MRPFSLLHDSEHSTYTYTASFDAVKNSICHPPCECPECEDGFYIVRIQYKPPFPYCRRLSDDAAKSIIRSYFKQTQEDRIRLTKLLMSHADVIMQRWKKNNQDKRCVLLKNVAPDLEETNTVNPFSLLVYGTSGILFSFGIRAGDVN